MPGYRLAYQARRDLDDIFDHIAGDSIGSALRVLDRFESTFKLLAESPRIGYQRTDVTSRPVRFFPVYSYLVVYLFDDVELRVVRVLSMARDLEQVFREPPGGFSPQGSRRRCRPQVWTCSCVAPSSRRIGFSGVGSGQRERGVIEIPAGGHPAQGSRRPPGIGLHRTGWLDLANVPRPGPAQRTSTALWMSITRPFTVRRRK